VKGLLRPKELARYADAIVEVGVAIGPGDDLLVTCQPQHRELAVALVEAGYRARARTVDVEYHDPLVRAAYLRSAPDDAVGHVTSWRAHRLRASVRPETASLFIAGESDPGALDGIPGRRVAADLTRWQEQFGDIRRASRLGKRRWSIAGWPTPAWAESVYPELDGEAAQRKLARDLLHFCRLDGDNGSGAAGLRTHLGELRRRAARLTRLDLRAVELRTPGTELKATLHPDSLWIGGGMKTFFGTPTAPNLPTEECFTSPIASGTEGTFRCTRPLMIHGHLIDGIAGEFRGGRLVRLEASRKADREFLAGFLFSVRGGDRLGEIALVDSTSRIGRAGRTYNNTLLDENAAAHVAFGSGFEHTRTDHETTRARRGVNQSHIHIDVMIGSDELEAVGTNARGRRIPLIAGGTWQI
jgi:aminopeptidase